LAKKFKVVSRNRQKLVRDQSRIKNQSTSCLKKYYPAALSLFSGFEANICSVFLRKYPNARVVERASLGDLKGFFNEQGYTLMRKVPRIYEKLNR